MEEGYYWVRIEHVSPHVVIAYYNPDESYPWTLTGDDDIYSAEELKLEVLSGKLEPPR